MKKNQFVKFSLTVVCAAVLAACSSSGGGDDDAARRAAEQAAQQEAARKAAAEAAAKAEAEAKAAQQRAYEQLQQRLAQTGDEGAKFVKKSDSNFVTNNVIEAANSKSSSSITGMTVPLYPTLDTIVVATPVDSNGNAIQGAAQVYLEDFDFRGNDGTVNPADRIQRSGQYTLKHIYKTPELDQNGNLAKGVTKGAAAQSRGALGAYGRYTKVADAGMDEGETFVYDAGRLNYTKHVEDQGQNVLDTRLARTEFRNNGNAKDGGRLDGSVAEVYGYRTYAPGDSKTGDTNQADYNGANAPFGGVTNQTAEQYVRTNDRNAVGAKKLGGADHEYIAGTKLNYVQYGRVTSKLNNIDAEADLKEGKNIVTLKTRIASYGGYGEKGTEDHYFYRGVNSTPYSATLANDLATYYRTATAPAGKLEYRGHAVTYNLDRDASFGDRVPNAIGYTQQLVSGTHVKADIDLATSKVTGNLYNVWQYSNGQTSGKVSDVLANFSGTVANNGSITGTAARLQRDSKTVESEGKFLGSLFGAHAEEMGGTLSSNDVVNNWGASFGAAIQNTPYVPGPTQGTNPALGESTDQNNTNNPNIPRNP